MALKSSCTLEIRGRLGADPGFPIGRNANPPGGGGGTDIQFYQIFQKLHEIEKCWAGVPLRSATADHRSETNNMKNIYCCSTLSKVQKILRNATRSENTFQSFNIEVYENVFFSVEYFLNFTQCVFQVFGQNKGILKVIYFYSKLSIRLSQKLSNDFFSLFHSHKTETISRFSSLHCLLFMNLISDLNNDLNQCKVSPSPWR